MVFLVIFTSYCKCNFWQELKISRVSCHNHYI